MSAKGTSFNDYLMEKLKDPELACHFISEVMTEHDPEYLKVAILDALGLELTVRPKMKIPRA